MTDADFETQFYENEVVRLQEHKWPDPDMSLVAPRKAPPPFPVEVLGEWSEWARSNAEGCSAPIDYVAVTLFSIVATIIGNSRQVQAWEGWKEPTIVWTALIGNPSSGKSPAADSVFSLAKELEKDLNDGFSDKVKQWATDSEVAKESRSLWEKDVKAAVKDNIDPPMMPDSATIPEKPVRQRYIVQDSTIESLGMLAFQHDRGLTMCRDELSGFIESLDRYNKGGDRSFWLEAYGGRGYTIDRVKHDQPIIIPRLSISLTGGIQPDKLERLILQGDDDGFAARILMTWPEPVPPRRPGKRVDNEPVIEALRKLQALGIEYDETGQSQPVIIPLSEEAASILDQWRLENAKQQKWATGLYLSHLGKMPGVTLRLSLILEFMRWAIKPEGTPEPKEISSDSFGMAADLVDEYFLPMSERAYGDASRPRDERNAIAIAKKIQRDKVKSFNLRKDVRRGWGLSGLRDSEAARQAIQYLVEADWVKATPTRSGDTSGRQSTDYEVNPKVWG